MWTTIVRCARPADAGVRRGGRAPAPDPERLVPDRGHRAGPDQPGHGRGRRRSRWAPSRSPPKKRARRGPVIRYPPATRPRRSGIRSSPGGKRCAAQSAAPACSSSPRWRCWSRRRSFTVSPAALAAGPKTDGATASAAHAGSRTCAAGSRGSVDVSKLSKPAQSRPSRPQLPFLENPSTGSVRGAASGPAGVGASAVPPPPVQVDAHGRPGAPTGPEWDGFSFADAGSQPPDPWVAVGPEHVVQTVNTVIQIFDRVGAVEIGPDRDRHRGALRPPAGLRQLRPARHLRQPARPMGRHARSAGPATATATARPMTRSATSTSSCRGRPTRPGVWDLYFFGFSERAARLPGPGTSTDKLAFTANLFTLRPARRLHDWPGVRGARSSSSPTGPTSWPIGGIERRYVDFDAFDASARSRSTTRHESRVQVPATSATLHYRGPAHDRIADIVRTPYYLKITGTVAADHRVPVRDPSDRPPAIVAETVDLPARPCAARCADAVTTSIDHASDRRDLAERSLHLGLDERLHADGRFHGAGLRPRDAAEHGRSGHIAADPRPGLPDRRERARTTTSAASASPATGRSTSCGLARRATADDQPSSQTAYQLPTDAANTLRGVHEIADRHRRRVHRHALGRLRRRRAGPAGPERRLAGEPVRHRRAELGDRRSRSSRPAARRTSRSIRCGCSTVAVNVGVTGIFNASTPKTFAGRRRRHHPGRRDRGDRQRHRHRPDGGRLRLGHDDADEHPGLVDHQLPDSRTRGPTT